MFGVSTRSPALTQGELNESNIWPIPLGGTVSGWSLNGASAGATCSLDLFGSHSKATGESLAGSRLPGQLIRLMQAFSRLRRMRRMSVSRMYNQEIRWTRRMYQKNAAVSF